MTVLCSSAEKCFDAPAPVPETKSNVAQTGSVLTNEEGQAVLIFLLISTMQQICP